MKYFTPQDVVEAWKRGEINRFKVRMNRNTARRCGYQSVKNALTMH